MMFSRFKKLPFWLIAFGIAGGLSMIPAVAGATSKSYFKSFGADVMTGGWFVNNSSCDTSITSNYQDPSYSNASTGFTADDRTGGILSYAKEDASGNSTGGSSSQYAIFAAGKIEGTDASSYGFYSGGSQATIGTTPRAVLTFSNVGITSSNWGGQFEGAVRQSSCIPDYYSEKAPTNPPAPSLASLKTSTAAGAYSAAAGAGTTYSLTSADVTIAAKSITIYVNGSVYIGNNIRYTLDKENNVPKFALVVKGSIYIDPSVTQLDGLYIAQPTSNAATAVQADDGDIWTCHLNSTAPLLYTTVGNCTTKLTINGALIAKQVNFMRSNGDVSSANTSEDNQTNASSSNNISEIINYTPAMEIGGPFFNPLTSSSLPVDSLISLPPIF